MSGTKKNPLIGWIPAAALAVAVVAILVTTGVLLSNGLGGPVPEPTEGQVTDLNWSSFTDDGLAYIAATRQVRIDLSKPPVDAAALGLDDDDTLVLEPIDNLDTQLDYDLIVNGGGEGPGGARFIVTEMSIETKNGVVTKISAPLREVVNFRQTLNYLIAQAVVFGWDTSHVDAIFVTAEDATRAGEPYGFTFGPADRTGVNFAATAECDTGGFCLVRYDVTPRVG